MSIDVLEWPAEEERRQGLAAQGRPRLLAIDPETAPPTVLDPLEDWIRRPYEGTDLQARLAGLRVRSSDDATAQKIPEIDDDAVLRTASGWLALTSVEAAIVSELIGCFDAVVDRPSLQKAAWPNRKVSRNLLDVYLHKLRPRVLTLGLQIVTVRQRGILLRYVGGR